MIFLSILIFILAMSLPFFKTQITPIFFTRISALSLIYAGVLTFNALHIQSIGSGIGIYSGFFQVTYFSLFIETFLYAVGALILLSWALLKSDVSTLSFEDLIRKENTDLTPLTGLTQKSKEYSLIALFSTLGGSLLLSSGDLLSMYLSIELQSFGLYILATIYRDSSSATGAGLKYFLLGGLSSCLILLGASLVYSFTGLTNFDSIYSLVSVLSLNDPSLVSLETGASLTNNVSQGFSLGLILIIVGFLFKIAAAPFHNWAPDVYDESPTNVTIWLTIMPKISIVIFLLELEMGIASQLAQPVLNVFTDSTIYDYALLTSNNGESASLFIGGGTYVLKNIFLLSSLLSLIVGTVVGLAQIRIKRLLAYSTISHVGFLLLALAICTEQSTESLILYLIQYIITSLNTFFILLAFGYIINSSIYSVFSPQVKTPHTSHTEYVSNITVLGKTYNSRPGDKELSEGNFITETYSEEKGKLEQLPFSALHVSKNSPDWASSNENASATLKTLNEGDKRSLHRDSDINFIVDLKGQFLSNPILSLSLAVCLFSMAGIPPLMGFFGKLSVLSAAIGNGYIFMALLAIIASVISAYYYLRIIKELHSNPTINTVSLSNLQDSGEPNNGFSKSSLSKIEPQSINSTLSTYEDSLPFRGTYALSSDPNGPGLSQFDPLIGIREKGEAVDQEVQPIAAHLILTNIHSFIIATLTLSILLFILKPSIILNSTVLLSLSLFNG